MYQLTITFEQTNPDGEVIDLIETTIYQFDNEQLAHIAKGMANTAAIHASCTKTKPSATDQPINQ